MSKTTSQKTEFSRNLEKIISEMRILAFDVNLRDLPLIDISTFSYHNHASVNDVSIAHRLLDKKDINVILTTNPDKTAELINRGVPIISIYNEFDLQSIVGCYRHGFYDCIWEKDDLLPSLYHAYYAGKQAFESGLESGKAVSIYEGRNKQPFVVLQNKDISRFVGPSYRPHTKEIKERARAEGSVVKDLSSTNYENLVAIVSALHPKKVLVNSHFVPEPQEENLRNLALNAERLNEYSDVIVIHDKIGLGSIGNVVADRDVAVDSLTRPSTIEDLMIMHLRKEKGAPHEEAAQELMEPEDAYNAPQGYHRAIQSRFLSGLWNEGRTQNFIRWTAAYYRRFLQLVQEKKSGTETPIIIFKGDACAEGAYTTLNPDHKYSPKDSIKFFKTTDHQSAWQFFLDSIKAQEHKPAFQQPEVMIPIPLSNRECFLVLEGIIGTNIRDFFYRLYHSDERKPRKQTTIDKLRSWIYDVELERLLYFQDHFSELNQIPTKELDLTALRRPTHLIRSYLENAISALNNRAQYTDIQFNDSAASEVKSALRKYDFAEVLREETIRRNLAATFRNSILRTYKQNISLFTFFKDLDTHQDKHAYLKRKIYRIDQAPKYSHRLEDAWTMLDSYEANLPEEEKHQRVEDIIGNYKDSTDLLRKSAMVMRLYRAIREADLYLSLYIPKLCGFYKAGDKTIEEFKAEKTAYTNAVRHYDQMALIACQLLDNNNPLKKLYPHLKRASEFTRITRFDNIK
jgi:hypothetical protein